MDSGLIFILVMIVAFLAYFVCKMVAGRSSQTSTKDWLLYFLIAPLMIAAFLAYFFYADNKGIDETTAVKWMNIFVTAVFVFGFSLKKFWRHRNKWTFWVESTVLVLAHFVVLQRLHWQKPSYFWLLIVIGLPEMFVVLLLLSLMFEPNASLSTEAPPQGKSPVPL